MANNERIEKVLIRGDFAENWTKQNTLLLDKELAFEIDTKKFKIGDGITRWKNLPYLTWSTITPSMITAWNNAINNNNVVVSGGDVVGPAIAVDNNVVFFDGITGKLIKDSGLTLSGTNTGDETVNTIGSLIDGSGVAVPNDTDLVATSDTSILKKITWANVKLFFKTHFDTIYQPIGTYLTSANISDTAFGVSWNGVITDAPSKNAIYDVMITKLDANTPITGATKTKITYDADGLVTSGADATTADIADSLDRRYVTDAQLVVITNTSGTNTGDNSPNSLYSGLVSNATHTGEVTGATVLTLDKTAITNRSVLTPAAGDHILVSDISDSDNLKKLTIANLGSHMITYHGLEINGNKYQNLDAPDADISNDPYPSTRGVLREYERYKRSFLTMGG